MIEKQKTHTHKSYRSVHYSFVKRRGVKCDVNEESNARSLCFERSSLRLFICMTNFIEYRMMLPMLILNIQ